MVLRALTRKFRFIGRPPKLIIAANFLPPLGQIRRAPLIRVHDLLCVPAATTGRRICTLCQSALKVRLLCHSIVSSLDEPCSAF